MTLIYLDLATLGLMMAILAACLILATRITRSGLWRPTRGIAPEAVTTFTVAFLLGGVLSGTEIILLAGRNGGEMAVRNGLVLLMVSYGLYLSTFVDPDVTEEARATVTRKRVLTAIVVPLVIGLWIGAAATYFSPFRLL